MLPDAYGSSWEADASRPSTASPFTALPYRCPHYQLPGVTQELAAHIRSPFTHRQRSNLLSKVPQPPFRKTGLHINPAYRLPVPRLLPTRRHPPELSLPSEMQSLTPGLLLLSPKASDPLARHCIALRTGRSSQLVPTLLQSYSLFH